MSIRVQLRLIERIVATGWVVGIALSLPVWLETREFPIVPIVSLHLGRALVASAVMLLSVALFGSLLFPGRRLIHVSIIVIALLLITQDLSRFQPWVYQYTLTYLALLFCRESKEGVFTDEVGEFCLTLVSMIMGGIYLWSGIHKFNFDFMFSVFPWLISPYAKFFPDVLVQTLISSALFIPITEVGIGIAFLCGTAGRFGVVAAIMMHLFILACLGPWALDYNIVVWPWNLVMCALVFVLFWRRGRLTIRNLLSNPTIIGSAMSILVLVLPALHVFNLWNGYPSFALYSGRLPEVTLIVPKGLNLPETMSRVATPALGTETQEISLIRWSYEAILVPFTDDPRVYAALSDFVCRYVSQSQTFQMRIDPAIGDGESVTNTFQGCAVREAL